MRYRILGPIEVLDENGRPVALGGRRERVLLAVLLLEANRVVTVDRLIDALWGEHPPETAANSLQVAVSKLRKKLASLPGPHGPLHTDAAGYVLRAARGELDSQHFEELATASASREDPTAVSARLAEALALWRGPVLAGMDIDVALSEVSRLEELRVSVIERRIDADLAAGRHAGLVGELEGLVRTHPLHEGLRGQLMLALYRSGRQADALAAYRQTREVLADQLGIDPSAGLQAMELAILNQSADLDAPSEQATVAMTGRRPSGTVTLLFSDIERAVRLWENDPDAMAVAVRRHDELMRAAIQETGGWVSRTVGGAFCAVFESAKQAIEAAVRAQRTLMAERWPEAAPVRVGVALHSGECEELDGDYFGPVVTRAARLQAVAHGGQVLLSRATVDLRRDWLPAGVRLRDLGTHRLKDLGRPEEVFQLEIDGLCSEFPPLLSLDNPGLLNNLPQLVSSFVGRDAEVTEVRRMVKESRLVTLTGAGGAGKTRLGLQVAAELADGIGDGVWLVELAGLNDPEGVPGAVAGALGVKKQTRQTGLDTLLKALAGQYVLVVIDNCEHLIGACAKLAEAIVRGCPMVHVLATSREPLGIDGERVFRVPSLSLPSEDAEDLSELAASEAVRLFVERARAQGAGFSFSADTAPLVAAICRRLDGIPLAIELAAVRLRSMSLAHLHDRLIERFRLLTGGSRTALARQQTLRATVDWSYGLLNSYEQEVFRRLSVFVGDFELEAAESVCGFVGTEGFEIADLLGSLVDKSLLVADVSGSTVRYRMLETLRQYGAERLAEVGNGEAERLRTAHAAYYLNWVGDMAPFLKGASQVSWLARLDESYPNLRAAFEHLLSCPEGAIHVLRLFGASRSYWWAVSSHDHEALSLLDRAFELAPEGISPLTRGTALMCRAYMLYSFDLVAQGACAREAVEFARLASDQALEAEALSFAGFNATFRGVPAQGLAPAAEAVAIARELDDPVILGNVLLCYGGIVEAGYEAVYREGLSMTQRSGDSGTAMLIHGDFGNRLLTEGRVDEARRQLQLALSAANASIPGSRARDLILSNLGSVFREEGDVASAAAIFTDLIRQARRSGEINLAAYAATGLACCATCEGDLHRAATLHGAASALIELLGSEWDSPESEYRQRDIAVLRARLGEDFERLYDSGRSMPRAEMLDFALGSRPKAHPEVGPPRGPAGGPAP